MIGEFDKGLPRQPCMDHCISQMVSVTRHPNCSKLSPAPVALSVYLCPFAASHMLPEPCNINCGNGWRCCCCYFPQVREATCIWSEGPRKLWMNSAPSDWRLVAKKRRAGGRFGPFSETTSGVALFDASSIVFRAIT